MNQENANRIDSFKWSLARVFDDNLRTRQWQNILDYVIIGLIVLSTVEVFLSTYDNVVEKYGHILKFIDWFTTIFFTIEVSLRIWVADKSDERYKGFMGRVRYCLSFYGLIDALSTYTFYLHFFMPVPYVALKVLRVFRLLRIFRYMKSFRILGSVIASKKMELTVSMAFLSILTIILSFLLYFAEHSVQPELCENGWKTMAWAFAKYLGDPGKIADFPIVTVWGNIIAIIVGVLGIAIVAVPAGLVSSGFIEVIGDRKKEEDAKRNTEKLRKAFERKLDRPSEFQIVPMFISIPEIICRLKMSEPDIFSALENSIEFRLVNLAATQTYDKHPEDRLVVEHFYTNTEYGLCIDRESKITIVSPSSLVDPIIGNFAYYVAKIGGFNYVSRELGEMRPYKSFYRIKDDIDSIPGLRAFLDDVNSLASRRHGCCITLLAASGDSEPEYPTQFHFCCGGKKGDEDIDPETMFFINEKDKTRFIDMYNELSGQLKSDFDIDTDIQRYHDSSSPQVYIRHLKHSKSFNSFIVRIAWSVMCWDTRRILIAKMLADSISKHYAGRIDPYPEELKVKGIGFSDYSEYEATHE